MNIKSTTHKDNVAIITLENGLEIQFVSFENMTLKMNFHGNEKLVAVIQNDSQIQVSYHIFTTEEQVWNDLRDRLMKDYDKWLEINHAPPQTQMSGYLIRQDALKEHTRYVLWLSSKVEFVKNWLNKNQVFDEELRYKLSHHLSIALCE